MILFVYVMTSYVLAAAVQRGHGSQGRGQVYAVVRQVPSLQSATNLDTAAATVFAVILLLVPGVLQWLHNKLEGCGITLPNRYIFVCAI